MSNYIVLDHKETLHDKSKINLFGTAYEIPKEDNYFDTVLCTEILNTWKNQIKQLKKQIEF